MKLVFAGLLLGAAIVTTHIVNAEDGRVNEQKSILESNRIGGAAADFAAPPVGGYQFSSAPSFRRRMAIRGGVETTQ
ncbi:hypothetical protein [Candidatus Binatus sp.]|uniref:hypothetical protein n=1 Tax=Candidatus Binatus sp. TaxID=2811406 RepID=UPI003F98E9DA